MRRALACACVRVVCVFVKGKGVADWVLRKIFELLDERAESGTHHHTREGEGQARHRSRIWKKFTRSFLDLAFKFLNKYAAKNNVKKSSRTAGKLRG